MKTNTNTSKINAGELLRENYYIASYLKILPLLFFFLVRKINNYWKRTHFNDASAAVAADAVARIKNPIIFIALFSCKNIKSLFSALASALHYESIFTLLQNVTIAQRAHRFVSIQRWNLLNTLLHTRTTGKRSFENDGVRCRCLFVCGCAVCRFYSTRKFSSDRERVW